MTREMQLAIGKGLLASVVLFACGTVAKGHVQADNPLAIVGIVVTSIIWLSVKPWPLKFIAILATAIPHALANS